MASQHIHRLTEGDAKETIKVERMLDDMIGQLTAGYSWDRETMIQLLRRSMELHSNTIFSALGPAEIEFYENEIRDEGGEGHRVEWVVAS